MESDGPQVNMTRASLASAVWKPQARRMIRILLLSASRRPRLMSGGRTPATVGHAARSQAPLAYLTNLAAEFRASGIWPTTSSLTPR